MKRIINIAIIYFSLYLSVLAAVTNENILTLLAEGKLGFQSILVTQRNPVNPTHVYTYHQEGLAPGGGLWICDYSSGKPELKQIIDSRDGVVLDANLHYDGKTILFSWKRTMNAKFQLYEVQIDGTGLKQITEHDSNNFNACWLPDGGIAFLSDRKSAFAYCWQTTTPILYRCDRDGSEVVRLSANYLNDFTPSILFNGRIVYSRWEYVDRPAIPIQSLWTINPDGTGLMGLFGNRVLGPATFMDAREIPDSGGRILCVLTAHNGPCRGAIGIIDPQFGANAQEGIKNLTPEIDIGKVDKGDGNHVRGPYLNPYPLNNEYYLVSKAGTIEFRDYGMKIVETILIPAGPGYYCPQPVRPRGQERLTASVLKKELQEEGERKWASIIMQDVYEGLGDAVKRGEIKQIAVIQEIEKPLGISPDRRAFGFQFPVISCGATYAPKRVWGYAKVEEDGSAHFKVPAQEPVYFLPLDAEGRAVQRMRTFTHLMPGEIQGCIGCHPDRNSVTPRMDRGSGRPVAALRVPQELEKPEWGVHGFSYSSIVQPVLDKHCIACHGYDDPGGGLELTGDKTDFFSVSYDNLARRGTSSVDYMAGGFGGAFKYSKYTSWIPTYNGQEHNILEIEPGRWGAVASLLAKLVENGHPDEGGKPRVDLSLDERRRIYAWIDLNVPYYGTSDSNYRGNRGCRQILPGELENTLREVAKRRCIECHKEGIPREHFTRIDNPERNIFLAAPLARKAGGKGICKPENSNIQPSSHSQDSFAVFANKDDPDYQKLLNLFRPVSEQLSLRPRMDMLPLDKQCATPQ